MASVTATDERRLNVLDGWRGISILLVLACHLLPLGPKSLQLNDMAGPMGMALFFTLSGFLITRFLVHHDSIVDFLIRRLFRIVPLAWLALAIALGMVHADTADYLPNFLFYANLPPIRLVDVTSHFWSLCVEMQFYVGVALLVHLGGKRALMIVPLLCAAVTLYRIGTGAHVSIVTWQRIDEILAGSMLALAYEGRLGEKLPRWIASVPPYLLVALLAASSHPASGALNYLRPYIAAALVGTSLSAPDARMTPLLTSRALAYVATISFALYVVHQILLFTWLGSGDTLVRYAKRGVLIALAFGIAHVSTFYFEQPAIALGKRLSRAFLAWRVRVKGTT